MKTPPVPAARIVGVPAWEGEPAKRTGPAPPTVGEAGVQEDAIATAAAGLKAPVGRKGGPDANIVPQVGVVRRIAQAVARPRRMSCVRVRGSAGTTRAKPEARIASHVSVTVAHAGLWELVRIRCATKEKPATLVRAIAALALRGEFVGIRRVTPEKTAPLVRAIAALALRGEFVEIRRVTPEKTAPLVRVIAAFALLTK